MFNLFIKSNPEGWTEGVYESPRDRSIVEYTAQEIIERYRLLSEEKIQELMSFPCLFVVENEPIPSTIGYLTNIKVREKSIVVEYEIDDSFKPLPPGTIESLRGDIELGKWELSRTHWAVKDDKILDILLRKGLITSDELNSSHFSPIEKAPINLPAPPTSGSVYNHKQVFIVHGHDDVTRLQVEGFLRSINIEPIVLSQQASLGKTIIEKIEFYSNVGFGIVLYTECDIGCKKGVLNSRYRARQNVVFEHGYLIGKLGRNRVAALVNGDIETPNDISGVVYISFDDHDAWKLVLTKEMREMGYDI